MGYEALRQRIQDALEETYPCPPAGGGWPWLIDFYPDEGFLIARVTHKGEHDLYRIMYTRDADGTVELTGDPEAVDEKYALRDTGEVIARQAVARRFVAQGKLVASGADAQKYLDTLVEKNPLFASLKGTPNTHLVVFDLTSIGKPSQHLGLVKYQLAKSGLAAALPTLISKPIHVTAGLDAHFDGDPKPIGVFLGGEGLENEDGTLTLRAIGTLWNIDFPDEIEEIGKQKAGLGASYELTYNPLAASRIAENVIELGEYQFSGGAILKKAAAAHPETQLLVAGAGYRTLDGTDLAAVWYQGSWQDTVNAILHSGNLDVLDEGDLQADPITTKERNALPDSDFALVQEVQNKSTGEKRKVRRFPMDTEARRKNAWSRSSQVATDLADEERRQVKNRIMNRAKREGDAWAKPYKKTNGTWVKGGTAMAKKYDGFTDEQAAQIDALVEAALAAAQTGSKAEALQGENTKLQADFKKAGEDLVVLTATLEETKVKLTTAEGALLEANKQLEIHQVAAAEALKVAEATALKAAVDAKLTDLGKKYGFTPKQLEAKRALVEKLVAGKEPLKPDEVEEIYAGAKVIVMPTAQVPLVAGSGSGDGVSTDKILETFPALRRIGAGAKV